MGEARERSYDCSYSQPLAVMYMFSMSVENNQEGQLEWDN